MIDFEEVKKYLPHYLSVESQNQLFDDLKKFPNNLDSRFYSFSLSKEPAFYQGDGVSNLLVVDLPDNKIGKLPSIIISNSCDIDSSNKRLFPSRVVYAPIFNLDKYKEALIKDHCETGNCTIETINTHIENIKKQRNTQIFFLPKFGNTNSDAIVFLDRVNNCPIEQISQTNSDSFKLFSLSNYGFYVFLIKLSIHFTRIRECIERPVTGEEEVPSAATPT